jgi:hypothetical protein
METLPQSLLGRGEMSLKLRPTGLGSGIDKDRPDYLPSAPASGRPAASMRPAAGPGQSALVLVAFRQRSVATMEEANAQFKKSWSAWKAWAKLDEVP